MKKKIAIINDIHSNYLLLDKILNYTEKIGVSDYIIGGDAITDGIWANEVLDRLQKINAIMINGNREESIINYDGSSWQNNPQFSMIHYTFQNISLKNMNFLKTLPNYRIVNIAGVKICISHGSPYNIRDLVRFDSEDLFDSLIKDYDADIYLFAHTHIPFNRKYKDKLFINVGALLPHDKKEVSFGILQIEDKTITYYPQKLKYDFEEVKNFYLNSHFYDVSPEWCNILINEFKDGIDYYQMFAKYINTNYQTIDNKHWKEEFNKFMKQNNLDIY